MNPPSTTGLPDEARGENVKLRGTGWSMSRADLDGCTIITARGEVDLDSTPALHVELADALARHSARVILDLTGVTFMDCSALDELVRARRDAAAEGGWVRLVAPNPVVCRLLDLTGAAPLFPIDPTVEAASSADPD